MRMFHRQHYPYPIDIPSTSVEYLSLPHRYSFDIGRYSTDASRYSTDIGRYSTGIGRISTDVEGISTDIGRYSIPTQ
jgi:hypothetical protein